MKNKKIILCISLVFTSIAFTIFTGVFANNDSDNSDIIPPRVEFPIIDESGIYHLTEYEEKAYDRILDRLIPVKMLENDNDEIKNKKNHKSILINEYKNQLELLKELNKNNKLTKEVSEEIQSKLSDKIQEIQYLNLENDRTEEEQFNDKLNMLMEKADKLIAFSKSQKQINEELKNNEEINKYEDKKNKYDQIKIELKNLENKKNNNKKSDFSMYMKELHEIETNLK